MGSNVEGVCKYRPNRWIVIATFLRPPPLNPYFHLLHRTLTITD